MNINVLNINDLLANMNTDFARGIVALLAVGALLFVLAKVRRAVADSAYRKQQRRRQGYQSVSRSTAKLLAKEGLKPQITQLNQSYRGTSHRRYEYR